MKNEMDNIDGILLKQNEEGKFEKYEPYAIVHFQEKEDFEKVKEFVEAGMSVKEIKEAAIKEFVSRFENIDTIIKSLKCCSKPYSDSQKQECINCPYRLLEQVPEDSPIPYDVEIDGILYYEGCDCEKIEVDGAELLERIKQGGIDGKL